MVNAPLQQVLEGKYEILEKIAEGGIGSIYKVRHRLLEEIRVVKVLRPQLSAKRELQRRFLHEARTAIRLRHPNIAQLYDFAVAEEGLAYIVMEYIDGVGLDDMQSVTGPPSLDLSIEIARQGLAALSYLHQNDFIHRDVSPDNLMLTHSFDGSPLVKLIDLGIAKNLRSTSALTATGMFLGKIRYSSPEQFAGPENLSDLDQRSDNYSFGILLYELLTGVFPIVGETFTELAGGHLFQKPKGFDETDPDGRVPAELRKIVLQALEKAPGDRIATADEFAERLAAFQDRSRDLLEEFDRRLEQTVRETPPGESYRTTGDTQSRLNRDFGMRATPAPSDPGAEPDPEATHLLHKGTPTGEATRVLSPEERMDDDGTARPKTGGITRVVPHEDLDAAEPVEPPAGRPVEPADDEIKTLLVPLDQIAAGARGDGPAEPTEDSPEDDHRTGIAPEAEEEPRYEAGERPEEGYRTDPGAQAAVDSVQEEREASAEAEREAREQAEREAQERAEREAREQAEREARERAEREAREQAEREARERAEREARARVEALVGSAREAVEADRLDEAVAHLHEALEVSPGHEESAALLASTEEEIGRREEARERQASLDEAASRIGALLDREEAEAAGAALADARERLGADPAFDQVSARLAELEQRIREDRVASLLVATRDLLEIGAPEEAQERLQRVLAIDPEHTAAPRLLEEASEEIRRRQAEHRRAATIASTATEIGRLLDRGKLSRAGKKLERATRDHGAEAFTGEHERYAELWYAARDARVEDLVSRGQKLAAAANPRRARLAVEEALALDPDSEPAAELAAQLGIDGRSL